MTGRASIDFGPERTALPFFVAEAPNIIV